MDTVSGADFPVYSRSQIFLSNLIGAPANIHAQTLPIIVIAHCPEPAVEDVERAIKAADDALHPWKATSGRERSRMLRKWNDLVLANKDDLAMLITMENGKVAPGVYGEVLFVASFLEWYSE